jgi:hypothetical protein
MLSFPFLFGWSWGGHGQMTAGAIVFAIARLIPLGKVLVMKRLNEFGALRLASDKNTFGSTPGKKEGERIEAIVKGVEHHAPTTMQQNLIHLFEDLPSLVQEQDLHIGNLPVVGEYLGQIPIIGPLAGKNPQIRHFMRSHESTTVHEAYIASRAHIWNNLYYAWARMKAGIYDKSHWYDFFYNASVSDFNKGIGYLAAALHTIEDSYAPGHVQRRSESGVIDDIHYWNKDNKKPNAARDWPGHEALDDPTTPQSRIFYQMGREASGSLMACVLANLDEPAPVYVANCTEVFNKHFVASFT